MTRNDTEIVSALRGALADRVGQERFELWFGASTRLLLRESTLTVSAPNRFFLEWIRSNFRSELENACQSVLSSCPAIEFRVDAQASEALAERPAAQSPASPEPAGPATATGTRKNGTASAESTLLMRRFADLASFVVGQTNRLASASAEMAVRRPGQYTPLVIVGPTGVGKTHLLQGIWTEARRIHPNLRAVYLSAEQFTSGFIEALRGSGLPSFRRKYRGVELLILDDLQFLTGKRATQVELLHTIDELLREGRQIVVAADRVPAEFSGWGPELITRLNSGMVCRVVPPDYATRLGIVSQMARRLPGQVPQEVQEFVAARLVHHARELSGALCRLQATSQALCRPITLDLAEEALAEMIRHGSRVVRLPDIERAVCDVLGVDAGGLQSGGKSKGVSYPRMLAMWLARKHTRAALSEIGEFFGRRTHSTVISAQKRVDVWMASGAPVRLADQTWSVDEAIRQVEKRLMAG